LNMNFRIMPDNIQTVTTIFNSKITSLIPREFNIDYARIDILRILPDCLEDSFIILIDDYNRSGEQEMVKRLETVLKDAGIKFSRGIYSGEKQLAVVTSEDWSFLCSL